MPAIYLDHAATTPLDRRVLEAMMPYLDQHYGNASSVHSLGRKARFAIEESREKLAFHLGATPAEIIFTSGATEANNLALKGMARLAEGGLLTSSTEHEAILNPAASLEKGGVPVHYLAPNAEGEHTDESIAEAMDRHQPGMLAFMRINNETGAVTDIPAIGALCRQRSLLLHCDAVQAAGYEAVRVLDWQVDTLSLSAHKMYGPKGVGALFVRAGTELAIQIEGGAQERKRRGGTENVAAIVGFAEAFELSIVEREERVAHVSALQRRLLQQLKQALGTTFLLNTPDKAAPHIVNIAFPPEDEPLDGEMLLLNLDMEDVYVSSGSACTSGAIEPSHVLMAMGLDRHTASAAIRFSLGKDTTADEIDRAVEVLSSVLKRMQRHLSA